MLFFTDFQTTESQFCLLNIKHYAKRHTKPKTTYFIDPGVYELKKAREYKHIDLLHSIARSEMPKNEYISIDYPCDMNLTYTDEFIQKSIPFFKG
jgi:hypothetical protein